MMPVNESTFFSLGPEQTAIVNIDVQSTPWSRNTHVINQSFEAVHLISVDRVGSRNCYGEKTLCGWIRSWRLACESYYCELTIYGWNRFCWLAFENTMLQVHFDLSRSTRFAILVMARWQFLVWFTFVVQHMKIQLWRILESILISLTPDRPAIFDIDVTSSAWSVNLLKQVHFDSNKSSWFAKLLMARRQVLLFSLLEMGIWKFYGDGQRVHFDFTESQTNVKCQPRYDKSSLKSA
jgi:hypothetical protein